MIQSQLSFEAINPEFNILRWYDITLGTDLFGDYFVMTAWGRKGQSRGQRKEYVFHAREEAKQHIISICRKRLQATSRIGCNYDCISHKLNLENLPEVFETFQLLD